MNEGSFVVVVPTVASVATMGLSLTVYRVHVF